MATTRKTVLIAALLGLAAFASAAPSDEVSFLVMGDWGGSEDAPYTTSGEISTAAGMQKIASTMMPTPNFSLALGDNFYSHGLQGDEHSPRFKNTFEDVFTGSMLQDPFKFKVVAGNHDHLGNVSAQIAYSNLSPRWEFPSEWYTFTVGGGSQPTVQIVLIDTVVIAGNCHVLDSNGRSIKELNGTDLPGPANSAVAESQLQWLEDTLKASTADYLVVGGHYPMYSICEHGPTALLIASVMPLLEKYKVTAYMNGHDHCMEYINTGDGVDYHTIGSAHSNDPSTAHADKVPKNSLKFHSAGKSGGFASIVANKTAFILRHHDGDGTLLYVTPAHAPRTMSAEL